VLGVLVTLLLDSRTASPLFDDNVLNRIATDASKKYRDAVKLLEHDEREEAREREKEREKGGKEEGKKKKKPSHPGNVTLETMFDEVTARLKQAYPGHIHDDTTWVFNCAGGFKTGMRILHASLTEYVIFWGSAVHTVGMSGRHAGEFHDFLMTGEFRQWKEGTVEKKWYCPGEHIYHGRWRGSIVELTEDTWMLEHMVGIIPWSLPFGLADSILSNQDFITVGKTLWTYARLVTSELLQGKLRWCSYNRAHMHRKAMRRRKTEGIRSNIEAPLLPPVVDWPGG